MATLLALLSAFRTALTLLLAAGSAAAAVAAQGGRMSSRLDILAHFAPFWLLGGIVALVLALLAPRGGLRGLTIALGLVATLAAGALIVPELTRPISKAPADAPRQLKLIQFNVWGRNQDPQRTVDWILAQQPDLVVMEELQPRVADLLRRQAKGYHLTCDPWGCTTSILSRARPVAVSVPFDGMPGAWAPTVRATFRDADGQDFTVLGVHYTWPTHRGAQRAQGLRLATIIDRFRNDATIVSGDFNSTPWSFSRRREDARFGLERRTRAVFSWPAAPFTRYRLHLPFPFLPIDQVYAGAHWRTVSVTRGPRLGSDHYPVVVVLAPRAKD